MQSKKKTFLSQNSDKDLTGISCFCRYRDGFILPLLPLTGLLKSLICRALDLKRIRFGKQYLQLWQQLASEKRERTLGSLYRRKTF